MARTWPPNDPKIMRAAIDDEFFHFFHEKIASCSFCKDPFTTLGFGALKWPPLAAPNRCPGIRIINLNALCDFILFFAKMCVARAAIRSRLMGRLLGAPKASFGDPALRRFRCLCPRASSVRIGMFFV